MEEEIEKEEQQIRPAVNSDRDVHDLEWFKARIGKRIYRTSRIWQGVCYKLQMVRHIPYSCIERFKLYRVPKKYRKGTWGCGEWGKDIIPDNMDRCLADCEKQFKYQKEWGFRYSDGKPMGFKVERRTI